MTLFRALTIQSGVTTQIQTANQLAVGNGIDPDVSGSLTIGSTLATSVVLGGTTTTTVNAGSNNPNFDFSGSTGTFKTSSGTVTISGATVFSGVGVTATGAGNFDFSGSSGTFKTSTGANTLSGSTTLAANQTFTAASGTGAFDFSAASGTFKTSSGAVSVNGNTTFTGTTTVTIAAFATAGVVHNSAAGLLTSSLVVNADVDPAAAIAVSKLAPGTAGQFLLSNGTPATVWSSLSGDGTLSSAGALKVTALQNNPVFADTLTVAQDGYVLAWDSTDGYWHAESASSSVVVTLAGDVTGPSNANTVVKINGTSVPATPTAAQVLIAQSGTAALWETFSQDATITAGGVVTVASAAAGFTVTTGNLTVSAGTATVSGTVTATSGLLSDSLDTITGTTLALGTSTATAVTLGKTGITTTIPGALTVTQATTLSALGTGVVHASGSGLLSSSKITVGTDITGGTDAQILMTNGSTPTWTTVSGDGTLSDTGVLTITQAAGNFEVKGNLTVDGAETIIGTSTFQNNAEFVGNVLVDDGYTLTVNTITSNVANDLTLEGATGFIDIPNGMTLRATGTGQIIATSSSGTTALTVPFTTTGLTSGAAVYTSANDTASNADNAAIATSYCVGFVAAVGTFAGGGEVYTDGLVTPIITGGTSTAGTVMYLDTGVNAGNVTSTAPGTGVVAPVGFMKNATQMIVRVLTPVQL